MRFVNIATAFALVALAQAFTIPLGTTDGDYAVFTKEDGTEVITKLSDAPEMKRSPTGMIPVNRRNALEPRQNDRIWCGCGFTLDPRNCDDAVQALKDQMKPSFVSANMSYFSIRGSVVAFACNRSPNRSWLLFQSQYADSLARITGACGRYIAGSTQLGDNGQALIYGYMRGKAGDNFCGASTSSPANHC